MKNDKRPVDNLSLEIELKNNWEQKMEGVGMEKSNMKWPDVLSAVWAAESYVKELSKEGKLPGSETALSDEALLENTEFDKVYPNMADLSLGEKYLIIIAFPRESWPKNVSGKDLLQRAEDVISLTAEKEFSKDATSTPTTFKEKTSSKNKEISRQTGIEVSLQTLGGNPKPTDKQIIIAKVLKRKLDLKTPEIKESSAAEQKKSTQMGR